MNFTEKLGRPSRREDAGKGLDSRALLDDELRARPGKGLRPKSGSFWMYAAFASLYTIAVVVLAKLAFQSKTGCAIDSIVHCEYLPVSRDKNTGSFCYSAPANEAISYHTVTFDNNLEDENVYKGTPRPELDKAWRGLLKCKFSSCSRAHLVLMVGL